MQRKILGVVTIVLLVVGVALVFAPGLFSQDKHAGESAGAVCLRSGVILAALWLALPDLARPRGRWVLLIVVASVVVLARQPKLIVLILAGLALLAILRPRLTSMSGPPRAGNNRAAR